VTDRVTPPHVDAIAWRGTPTPSTAQEALAAPDLASGVRAGIASAEDWRAIALTLLEHVHVVSAERDAARAEVRRLREAPTARPTTPEPTRDPEYMRQVYAYLRDEDRS
jgi:hypothetical protein